MNQLGESIATLPEFQGQVLHQVSLTDYNTWRVGGYAKTLYKPNGVHDLVCLLSALPAQEPLLWLGLGSNSLIKDNGFAGSVIVTQGCLNGLTLLADDSIRVEAGVSCAKLARFAARNNLADAEFWAGIPGTMGGALRMNAGCFNGATWDRVVSVETISRTGEIRHRNPAEFSVAYRHVSGLAEDEWFIAATYRFLPGNKEHSLQLIKDLLERRMQTQPTSEYNCGSVFRNPPNDYAARLIESCGLKGYNIGGAMVSHKHANFITNHKGQATATDIEALIRHVQQVVRAQTAIELTREVHILGDIDGTSN